MFGQITKIVLISLLSVSVAACVGTPNNNSCSSSKCCESEAKSGEVKNNSVEGLHSNYPKLAENYSAAMKRNNRYESEYPMECELYTTFKYTKTSGFDYNGGDGTRSRRDPSKVIFENGKYYVWYTHRHTPTAPNQDNFSDVNPSVDWDLAEIWYATSTDGFTWEEQVAIERPKAPTPGHRSVSTADILKFEGKFYLYYQAFSVPSGGGRGDFCPVSVSVADTPDGPWKPIGVGVVERGAEGEWDANLIHDPFPLVHDGKIYLYYKSGFNHRDAGGLAIAERPEGPYVKHPLNPVLNSGHEVSLFPFREGVAAMVIKAGNEHNTIQFAEDRVNFEIASFVNVMPNAPGSFIPDAFTDSKNASGTTWGLCHFLRGPYTELHRFDCDLNPFIDDRGMKAQVTNIPEEVYFRQKLGKAQMNRIKKENAKLQAEYNK